MQTWSFVLLFKPKTLSRPTKSSITKKMSSTKLTMCRTLSALILISISSLFKGCKEKTLFPNEKEGMVIWTGSSQVDAGCDYMIVINSTRYKPLNLSPEFEQDSLLVKVKYTLKGKNRSALGRGSNHNENY